MSRMILFAGTFEGRRLAETLVRAGKEVLVCVATEYGEELMESIPAAYVRKGRLDASEMEALLQEQQTEAVVDATHPYAVQVSRNIRQACDRMKIRYLRLLRPQESDSILSSPDVIVVNSVQEAAAFLAEHQGNALITTGSRELLPFTSVPDYQHRLTIRVLPSEESVRVCRQAGFDGKNIIAMQGPFSEELNTAFLKETGASWLVTKESGNPGGFRQKIAAARNAGAGVILIRRPLEKEGYTLEEILQILCPEQPASGPVDPSERVVCLIGAGMGRISQLTLEAHETIEKADVLIGSTRLIRDLSIAFPKNPSGDRKLVFESYKSEEICSFLDSHPEYRTAAVVYSGDIGFYSGAKSLLSCLRGYQTKLICGISSVQYFCAKCQIPWEDVQMVSLHGRNTDPAAEIRRNKRVFMLAGEGNALRELSLRLAEYGFGSLSVQVGVNLTYQDEQIFTTTIRELSETTVNGLAVLLIENPAADTELVTHGIPDEAFIRDQVPMTKEEVRSVAISRLHLTRDAIVYDIGAGTGSVSVEIARLVDKGRVLAIEKQNIASELILANARRFGVTNLELVCGEAPEILSGLPVPTHAFIGGSSGRLAEICDSLKKMNPEVRIVVTAVSLEGISSLTAYLQHHPPLHQELTMLNAARVRHLGDYHLMTGQNPVLIAAFDMKTGDGSLSPFSKIR